VTEPALDNSIQRVLVTGGAGFIGSNVVDTLLSLGREVVVYDNFRTGRREFVADALATGGARLVEGDVLDGDTLTTALAGVDQVIHLAANADVRRGLEHPHRDLEQNTIGTATVLEAMRTAGVDRIAFSSTGSVYGEPEVFPTPEDAPFPLQTSLYGASKLAGEGLLAAYAVGYGMSAVIYRFVSILGERYTHGHVFDFWASLRADPTTLTVLGDGRQNKSYLYVGDCVSGILRGITEHAHTVGPHVYNLGHEETLVVDDSVGYICEHLGVSPQVTKTGGARGWVGDSPLIHLDCSKIRSLGWAPTLSIKEAVGATVAWLDANPYVLEGSTP
jgi:UDP-glucose 4-epimerase